MSKSVLHANYTASHLRMHVLVLAPVTVGIEVGSTWIETSKPSGGNKQQIAPGYRIGLRSHSSCAILSVALRRRVHVKEDASMLCWVLWQSDRLTIG
jgi:hypothetical protein